MRERLESAGGSMLIDTKSGDGFRVHVTLPGAAS
jgi:signal transduction histidine kinase